MAKKRRAFGFDERQQLLIENAIYASNPPESSIAPIKVRRVLFSLPS